MVSVSTVRHSFSGCACGHNEHVGNPDWQNRYGWHVVCPACTDIEQREQVIIATDTLARIEQLAIAPNMAVRHNGQTCRVIAIEPVTRLNGSYHTGYAIVKLRETAA